MDARAARAGCPRSRAGRKSARSSSRRASTGSTTARRSTSGTVSSRARATRRRRRARLPAARVRCVARHGRRAQLLEARSPAPRGDDPERLRAPMQPPVAPCTSRVRTNSGPVLRAPGCMEEAVIPRLRSASSGSSCRRPVHGAALDLLPGQITTRPRPRARSISRRASAPHAPDRLVHELLALHGREPLERLGRRRHHDVRAVRVLLRREDLEEVERRDRRADLVLARARGMISQRAPRSERRAQGAPTNADATARVQRT